MRYISLLFFQHFPIAVLSLTVEIKESNIDVNVSMLAWGCPRLPKELHISLTLEKLMFGVTALIICVTFMI